MVLRRRKNEEMQVSEAQTTEVDVAREIVVDMESVRNAIQTCLDFEKEKGIQLINPKGKADFSQTYKKYEAQNKVRQLVIDTVKEEVQKQIAPVDKKLTQLMSLITQQYDDKKIKTVRKQDIDDEKIDVENDNPEELRRKIDRL